MGLWSMKMNVNYRVFRGTWTSWETLFNQASEFASLLNARQLISISHSADGAEGVVTVWYWSTPQDKFDPGTY
jgi:hypothetical protein